MVWSVMSDPLGLSIGTTNLVAARVGNQPVIRRSVLTLAGGTLLTGFVERIGDSVPLVAPDGSTHHADRLLVDALGAILQASGGQPVPEIAIAVPAYWGMTTLRTLRTALRADPDLAANGTPARLVSDAVASLTALHANLGLPSRGVVALLDFGGGGTSITLTDAGAAFEPIDESIRFTEFSGDQIDQALLSRIVDRIAATGGIDPSGTAAVSSLAPTARGVPSCQGAAVRRRRDGRRRRAARLPGDDPGGANGVGVADRRSARRCPGGAGKCVEAQRDWLAERRRGGHGGRRCEHSADRTAPFGALERTRRDDTAARIRRSGGCGALRGIRFCGRGPDRYGAGGRGPDRFGAGGAGAVRHAGIGDCQRAGLVAGRRHLERTRPVHRREPV